MSATDGTRRELPARPSKEHLRKQAKRLSDRQSLGLAQAQRKIAAGYGSATWADLMHRVDIARGAGTAVPLSPLAAAAHAADLPAVQHLLLERHAIEGARGDVGGLARLLDAELRLLRERIVEPECYREAGRPQYFRDPKLFWFIANNPTLMKRMPDNIVEVAEVMIARGVGKADLDYALELVMTSSPPREQGLQIPLVELLLRAGATATTHAIDMTLGHLELAPILPLRRIGHRLDAPIAAALGRTDQLVGLLRTAPADEIQNALGMAVINGRTAAAHLTAAAVADHNRFLPVPTHSLPLHQAVLDENL